MNDDGPVNCVKKLFRKADDSQIELVRLAINFNNALEAEGIAQTLKLLGYRVAINLMQSHGKTDDQYLDMGKKIAAWNALMCCILLIL